MSLPEETPVPARNPYQFRLQFLFVLTTVGAAIGALGHYFGEVVLYWLAGLLLVPFLVIGPGLITEVLTLVIDPALVVIGVARLTLCKRLGLAAHAGGQNDVARDPNKHRLINH